MKVKEELRKTEKLVRDAAKDGFLLDQQGNEIKEGDRVMYISGTGSSTYLNYGTVLEIKKHDSGWNPWSIKVLKQGSTGWFEKVRPVWLHNPLIFLCGTELRYPE